MAEETEDTTTIEEETPVVEGPGDAAPEPQDEVTEEEEPKKKGTSPIKIIGILILVFGLLVVLGGAYLYFGLVKPLMGLDITPQDMQPVSLDPLTFEGMIDFTNPGSDVTLPQIDLNLYIDDTLMASGGIASTTIPGGSTKSVTVQFISPMTVTQLTSYLFGKTQVSVKIGGKIHSKPFTIPIPPISVPMDTSEFLADFNTPTAGIIKTLGDAIEKNPDLSVAEAFDSPEFLEGMEEQLGKDVSDEEIAQLISIIEAQGIMDERAEDVLNNPGFIALLEDNQ